MPISVAFQPTSKPTINEFLNLNCGVLPQAIYEGGQVLTAPGRAVQILPFKAKTAEGLLVTSDTPYFFPIAAAYYEAVFYLVLYAKAWTTSDATKAHTAEFRLVSSEDWPHFAEKAYCIPFAAINIPDKTGNPINPSNIDSSIALRLDLFANTAQKIYSGTGKFNTANVISHDFGTVNYRVSVTPSELPTAGLGDIWVEKTSNSFTVKCDATDLSSSFDWIATLADSSQTKSTSSGYSYAQFSTVATGPALQNTDQTILASVPVGLDLSSPLLSNLYWAAKANTYLANDSWSLKTALDEFIPVRWKMLDTLLNTDLIFYDVPLQGGSFTVDVNLANVEAFLIPTSQITDIPYLTKNIDPVTKKLISVTASAPGRVVLVQNASNYLRASVTGLQTTYTFPHGLNSKTYLPLFNISGFATAPTQFRMDLGENSMTFAFNQPVNLTWLIL